MKLVISKLNLDENIDEPMDLLINDVYVGTYSSAIYSKWYLNRVEHEVV